MDGGRGRAPGRGTRGLPGAGRLPLKEEAPEHSSEYLDFCDGKAAAEGAWPKDPSPDGHGEFAYAEGSTSSVPMPPPTHLESRYYGTTEIPNRAERIAGTVQDMLNEE